MIQGIGERHLAKAMVVAVTLPVGGHVDELRLRGIGRKRFQEPGDQSLAAVQQLLKGNGPRGGSVVEEDAYRASGGQPQEVGHCCLYAASFNASPFSGSGAANARRLVRGEHREFDAGRRHDLQCFQVHRRFRQPHPFRPAMEPVLEISYPP